MRCGGRVLAGVALTLLAGAVAACGRHHVPKSGGELVVQSFQMTDPQVGWAVWHAAKGNGAAIFRTTDGGAHWARVFRATRIAATDFLDSTHAWVLGSLGPFVIAERTSDGGASWQGITNPPDPQSEPLETESLNFVTPEVGWVALCVGYDSLRDNLLLDQTTDGGNSWTVVPFQPIPPGGGPGDSAVFTVNGPHHPLELTSQGCGDSAIDFLDSEHGVLSYGGGIARTSDGGRIWTTVALPPFMGFDGASVNEVARVGAATVVARWVLPAAGGSTSAAVPTRGREAKCPGRTVPATVPPPQNVDTLASHRCSVLLDRPLCEEFVISGDGGQHWQESRIFAAGPHASYSFLPSGEGWVAVGDSYLYHTTDAGQSWQVLALGGVAAGRVVTGVQFLSSSLGWAVLAGMGGCGPTGSILAKTTDGGQSWVTVDPAFGLAAPHQS